MMSLSLRLRFLSLLILSVTILITHWALPVTAADPTVVLEGSGLGEPSVGIAENGYIFAATEVTGDGGKEIHILRSTDSGMTWGLWERLWDTIPEITFRYPSLLVTKGTSPRVCVAYAYLRAAAGLSSSVVFISASALSENPTWTAETVATTTTEDFFWDPYLVSDTEITGDDYNLFLVYAAAVPGTDPDEIRFKSSTNGGTFWVTRPLVFDLLGFYDDLHLSWVDNYLHCSVSLLSAMDRDILYRGKVNPVGGESWGEVQRLTQTGDDTNNTIPSTAADPASPGEVVATYTQASTLQRVRISTDSGVTWDEEDGAISLQLERGILAHGPDGYAIAGRLDSSLRMATPANGDPAGQWNVDILCDLPAAPLSGMALAHDPTHDDQWGVLFYLQGQMLFYGRWFEDPADVVAPPTRDPATFVVVSEPNPFSGHTRISLDSPTPYPIRLTIVDIRGRLIREFADPDPAGGTRSFLWNGTDDLGQRVAPGVYFYDLKAAGSRRTGRLVLVR